MTEWIKSTVDFVDFWGAFAKFCLPFWAFDKVTWFESVHDSSSISETWIDSTHDSSGFPGIDSDNSSEFPRYWFSLTLDSKCFRIFRFKSTHDSSEEHLILSRLMIRLRIIPMGKRVPKISIQFTSQTSVVNTPICSPFQSNCNIQSVFRTKSTLNQTHQVVSGPTCTDYAEWNLLHYSPQALVTRLNGRNRGIKIGTVILILIDSGVQSRGGTVPTPIPTPTPGSIRNMK